MSRNSRKSVLEMSHSSIRLYSTAFLVLIPLEQSFFLHFEILHVVYVTGTGSFLSSYFRCCKLDDKV